MATPSEITVSQKQLLTALLKIKRANANINVAELQDQIEDAVAVMQQDEVAWVEKVIGIKAL